MNGADVPVDVTVSIATYDRPDSLALTLKSVLAQRNALRLKIEVLVTDNHPSGNAEPVVRRLTEGACFRLRYQTDLTRNMSMLRNAGIKAAHGAFVAFIDDDEQADPDWLDALVGAARRTGADIAVGPRLATFQRGRPPAFDPQGRCYERVWDFAPDAVIPLTDPDGRPRYGLGTGNSLIRAATALTDPEPFDPAFGDAHGEDIEYFVRQHRLGRRIVWAADARVTEMVPDRRATVAYRLIRARRETQIYVSIYLAHTPGPRLVRAKLFITGLAQLILGAAVVLGSVEFGSSRRVRGRTMVIKGLAKLSRRNPVGHIDESFARPAVAQ